MRRGVHARREGEDPATYGLRRGVHARREGEDPATYGLCAGASTLVAKERTLTQEQIIRAKVGLLELAKQLANVSQACKMMGYSRDSFYRFKELYDKGGELDLPPIKRMGLGSQSLGMSWAEITQSRVQAAGIVEALDLLEQIASDIGAGSVNPVMNPLGLERVKEAFHWCIVETIAFAAHRRRDADPARTRR